MFGCFGLCGDCFSTSPIPLLVKRFYCSFAIQSKERKEKEEEGGKYCSIEKLENSTVTKNIGNIPLASLRSERSQWLTKSPPPIPSKKDPFCKKLFFSFNFCPVFEFFSYLFLSTGLPGLSNVSGENIFHFDFFLKLCYSTVSVALQSGSGAQLESKEGGFSGNRRHHYFSKTSTLFLEEHQHYFFKNINSIWQKNFRQPFNFKRTFLDMAIFFSVKIERIFCCKTSTVVQNSILYNFFSLRNSSEENLLRENGKSWNCLSSHPQTFQHKNFSDVTDTNSQ